MKIIKYIIVTLALIITVTQCKLPDNINPKAATEVPVETLFTNAEVALFNQVDNNSVNLNTTRLYVQYWQQTTYFDESRYLMIDRNIPDNYIREFYRDALMDFKEAKGVLTDPNFAAEPDVMAALANRIAIIDILMCYGYQACIDHFGDLPYTESLSPNETTTPVYDDAAAVYDDLIKTVSTAVNTLGNDAGKGSWGITDVMYDGDDMLWRKFGASLLLRMGMRLADVSPDKSKAAVAAAVNAGVYSDMSEAGYLHYTGITPHVNDIYDSYFNDGRKDYLPTNTIVDMMSDYEDPRIFNYFTTKGFEYDVDEETNVKIDTELSRQDPDVPQTAILVFDADGSTMKVDLPYMALQADTLNTFSYFVGAVAGLDGAQSYQLFSHFQDVFFEPTFPAMIIDYIETEFLLAEAAARGGYAVSGSAEEHYNNAIKASIMYWGSSEADADTYLASAPVKFDQANWKMLIGEQKWLALYNRGIEAWSEWKRLDYPILNTPEGMSYGDIPLRFYYPFDEEVQNAANWAAASSKIGGDETSTPVFWDVVPTPAK